jgi:hypothetical protein
MAMRLLIMESARFPAESIVRARCAGVSPATCPAPARQCPAYNRLIRAGRQAIELICRGCAQGRPGLPESCAILFPVGISLRRQYGSSEEPSPARSLPQSLDAVTILFIALSTEQGNPAPEWALSTADGLLRSCPRCLRDSIFGHGRRDKQAHDENQDWIAIRRGICHLCGTTFTFRPWFSLPYTNYSLFARSEALRRRFVEQRRWEDAAPAVQDPNRVADLSTLHRWSASLDSSPSFAFLRKTLEAVTERLDRGEIVNHRGLRLSWRTVAACLQVLWPLRP